MTNQELLEEIRENRREIKKLHEDFYLFKSKAFFFMGSMSVFFTIVIDYTKGKFGL